MSVTDTSGTDPLGLLADLLGPQHDAGPCDVFAVLLTGGDPIIPRLTHRLAVEVDGRRDFVPVGAFVLRTATPDKSGRVLVSAYNDLGGAIGPPIFVGDPDLATTTDLLDEATA